MAAPPEIIDALESIIDIYFSYVHHRERAAFILCDNLVEMACKTKATQHNHAFNGRGFHAACTAPGVNLPQRLRMRVEGYRNTRNTMQHANAAATVSAAHCATAILDAVKVIDHCWKNTSQRQFNSRLRCALRIVRLYSSEGDEMQRDPFESTMRQKQWRAADRESVRPNARQIEPGNREFWLIAIRLHTSLVEECLNEIGVP